MGRKRLKEAGWDEIRTISLWWNNEENSDSASEFVSGGAGSWSSNRPLGAGIGCSKVAYGSKEVEGGRLG